MKFLENFRNIIEIFHNIIEIFRNIIDYTPLYYKHKQSYSTILAIILRNFSDNISIIFRNISEIVRNNYLCDAIIPRNIDNFF